MWCFFFFCEKQIMRVDKVRLSWFILLNSYSLKKEKEKSGHIHSKRKEKWNINPYACEQGCLDSSYQTHTFSKTEEKKMVIYFQEEKKRKNIEVNYASVILRPPLMGNIHNKNNNSKVAFYK
jgi:hypothetical protein